MKIKNRHLANNSTTTSFGVLSFNEHGCTDVSEEAANALLAVPNFSKCVECDCGEVPKEEVKAEAKPRKMKKQDTKVGPAEGEQSEESSE